MGGGCGGAKIFDPALPQPARSVCVSLSAFYNCDSTVDSTGIERRSNRSRVEFECCNQRVNRLRSSVAHISPSTAVLIVRTSVAFLCFDYFSTLTPIHLYSPSKIVDPMETRQEKYTIRNLTKYVYTLLNDNWQIRQHNILRH